MHSAITLPYHVNWHTRCSYTSTHHPTLTHCIAHRPSLYTYRSSSALIQSDIRILCLETEHGRATSGEVKVYRVSRGELFSGWYNFFSTSTLFLRCSMRGSTTVYRKCVSIGEMSTSPTAHSRRCRKVHRSLYSFSILSEDKCTVASSEIFEESLKIARWSPRQRYS